jgi:hypothetical protein
MEWWPPLGVLPCCTAAVETGIQYEYIVVRI